ncbi:MAG TPA: class I SAM-dependent methyltransferase [Actinomycetota bacterium]
MGEPEDRRDALVERLFAAGLGMGEGLTVYLGDRLGLYRALDRAGSLSSPELAADVGIFERYAREWLEQQAAAGILSVDDVDAEPGVRRYSLPPGHAEPLLDPDSAASIAPFVRSFVAIAGAMPSVMAAFRSGDGVEWRAYGQDMTEAQGDFNRPWIRSSLGAEYLPSIPDLHERLLADGARVADVACGVGWAGISLAAAYPGITVDGFDPDEPSIELARSNADAAGLADRVRFHAIDAAEANDVGEYDLAVVVESIHDMAQPVAVLRTIRSMLKPGGTLIVADERVEDRFTAPAGEVERVFYAYSVLCCLPSGMEDDTAAGTGTVMRRSTFEGYAHEAGFGTVEVLPIEHDFLRFYRLDA